jgi:flagellar biosynthesis protein FliP
MRPMRPMRPMRHIRQNATNVAARRLALSVGLLFLVASPAWAQQDHADQPPAAQVIAADAGHFLTAGPQVWTSPEGLSSSLQILLLLTVLSLAPSVLLMTTSFIRIVVVLGLLRQALGTQQLPPSQVITAISLFMTVAIMMPVWSEVYNESIAPYTDPAQPMSLQEAWSKGVKPVRHFMSRQIEAAGNSDDVWLFYSYYPQRDSQAAPESYDDVPLQVLLPAFVLSELKTAFLIGFQIYLPFLILDMVIASVTVSMGMMMLPQAMISLPFKLLLFVMVDGWHLVVGMLLESFALT